MATDKRAGGRVGWALTRQRRVMNSVPVGKRVMGVPCLDNGKAVQRTLPQVFVNKFEMMICEDVSVQLKNTWASLVSGGCTLRFGDDLIAKLRDPPPTIIHKLPLHIS
jgi:hypothetical protein